MSKDSRLKVYKYINDPVYGSIPITQIEMELIDTPIFQRLRGLRQLARVNYVFPGAEHSRFVHSLGVLYIMGLMTEYLLERELLNEDDVVKLRIAALLHDIGHYPFSHLGETVFGYIDDENKYVPGVIEKSSKEKPLYEMASYHSKAADHERLGAFIVRNNEQIKTILERNDLDPEEIGDIFTGKNGSIHMVYNQLLHSSLDADRLDYLLRDSYQTGVRYGLVDLEYLIKVLDIVDNPGLSTDSNDTVDNRMLVCRKKGQHVVEHFLMSRYFHYSQVIFHKTNTAFEGLLRCLYIKLVQAERFVFNSLEEIQENVNNESFLYFTDSFLESSLEKYYEETDDEDYKRLYEMYRDRIRPKVVYDTKVLYGEYAPEDFSYLRKIIEKEPQKITDALGTDSWGYQFSEIKIEKLSGHMKREEFHDINADALREAVKIYDYETGDVKYLAEDELSVIGKLSNYSSEFARIYVMEKEETKYSYEEMRSNIDRLVK